MMKVVYTAILLMLLSLPAYAGEGGGFMFSTDPRVGRVSPEKPVDIKLKRLKGGEYTWVLKGEDADAILKVDKKLRKGLGIQKNRQLR